MSIVVCAFANIRTDFRAVMRLTASHWFTDSIYPFKRFAFLLLFHKTEYCLSPFKKMRCFDKKKTVNFSQNCTVCRRPNYTLSSASFNFTFVTRDFFMLSFAATLCYFIIKVTFHFFSDDLFREYCSL